MYLVKLKPKAIKDLQSISKPEARKIAERMKNMKLHPQLIEKKGKKEFVVLPYDEFMTLEEIMHDYEDLKDLRAAKEKSKNQAAIPIDKVIKKLGL